MRQSFVSFHIHCESLIIVGIQGRALQWFTSQSELIVFFAPISWFPPSSYFNHLRKVLLGSRSLDVIVDSGLVLSTGFFHLVEML